MQVPQKRRRSQQHPQELGGSFSATAHKPAAQACSNIGRPPAQQPPKQQTSWLELCPCAPGLCSLSHMTAMGCFFCCAAGIDACPAGSPPGCASDCSTVQSPTSPTAASDASWDAALSSEAASAAPAAVTGGACSTVAG